MIFPKLQTPKTVPQCPGCGYTVAKVGDVCASCSDKPRFQAPKAQLDLGPKQEPRYVRESPNFAKPSPTAPVPD